MSYSFDGANDTLTGTFTSSYSDPCTWACWVKVTDHPLAVKRFAMFGNNSASNNDAYSLGTAGTDNVYQATTINSTGTSKSATFTSTLDNTWFAIVGRQTSDVSGHWVFVQSFANSDFTTAQTIANAVKFIRLGESFTGANDLNGLIAEVAFWNTDLSDADITSYLSGTAASSISAANLVGYWPLSSSGATQNNLGTDTAGDLTVSGATFSSDHPTITSGGSSVTMAVTSASFSLSGQAVALGEVANVVSAAIQPATQSISLGVNFVVGNASFQIDGKDVVLSWPVSGSIAVGTAGITPVPADIILAVKLPVDSAIPTIAPQDIVLTKSSLTSPTLGVDGANFSIGGSNVEYSDVRLFDQSAFSIVGKQIPLSEGAAVVSASPTIAPQSITLTWVQTQPSIGVISAAFSIVGQDITLQQTWSVAVASASFSILGQNIPLQWQANNAIVVQPAVFSPAPQTINLDRGAKVVFAPFSLAGQSISLTRQYFIGVEGPRDDTENGQGISPFSAEGQDIALNLTFTLGINVTAAGFQCAGSQVEAFLGSGNPTRFRVEQLAQHIEIGLGNPTAVVTVEQTIINA